MLLSDLLGKPVHADGRPLGYVLDARFVVAGTPRSHLLADAELLGLLVGPRPGAAFLGYERRALRGPALLRRWLRSREHGSFLVDCDDVLTWDDVVELRPGFERWSPAL